MTENVKLSSEVVYDVKDLNLWYGKDQALRNINMQILKNRVTAIIGPSGCGKSTFIKTLNRMIENIPVVRTTGEINYHGTDIFDKSVRLEELRTRVGMVFQNQILFQRAYTKMCFMDLKFME